MKSVITKALLGLALICMVFTSIYYIKIFNINKQQNIINQIKEHNDAFIEKTLNEFDNNINAKASSVCKKVVDEMNNTSKNPYKKDEKAFTYDTKCVGCTSVEFFDNEKTIIVTTLDKKGKLQARTVIKPPSFVTYSK